MVVGPQQKGPVWLGWRYTQHSALIGGMKNTRAVTSFHLNEHRIRLFNHLVMSFSVSYNYLSAFYLYPQSRTGFFWLFYSLWPSEHPQLVLWLFPWFMCRQQRSKTVSKARLLLFTQWTVLQALFVCRQ